MSGPRLWHDGGVMRAGTGSARMWAAAALPLLLAAFHWQLLVGPRAVWFASDDNAFQVLPWLEVQARAWRAGQVPLWDPYQWMGQPLLGQAQPAVASPLNWLLAFKPEGAAGWLWLNLYFLLIRWIGAGGMYRLARGLGCGRAASVAAGFAYATAGWFAFSLRPQMAMGAMWAPWVLRHLLRALGAPEAGGETNGGRRLFWNWLRRPPGGMLRHAVIGGFFLGLSWLGGHHQAPLYLTVACGLLWLGYLIGDPRRIAGAVLFFATAAAAAAPQVLPAVEYGRRAVRWVGLEAPVGWREKIPLEIHARYSLPAPALPALVWPGHEGRLEVFHGSLLLVLALTAVWGMRTKPLPALAAMGVAGIWISMGPAWGLHRWLYEGVPHFEKARVPATALVLLGVTLPALAAAGIGQLSRSTGREWWRTVAAALLAAFAAGTAMAAWQGSAPGDLRWRSAAGAAAAAALVWISRTRLVPAWVFACVCLAALAAELCPLYMVVLERLGGAQAARNVRLLEAHADVAEFLRARGTAWRAEIDDGDVPYNFGGWHGVLQAQGYLASVTENLYRHEIHTPQAKRLFAVRYRVARSPSETHARMVFAGARGVNVYEWDGALPRTFIVHEAVGLADRRHAAEALAALGERTSDETFLPGPVPALERCAGPEEARIVESSENRVVVEARLGCRGMVILSDTWFPGWRAWVDGRRTRIHEAYAAVRGVVVDGGAHRIEFRYLPGTALAGAALWVLAACAAGACARRGRLH
ncbi:MAG: hypothetical protein ACUVS7_03960 [Bryobacteraceae bacterium]